MSFSREKKQNRKYSDPPLRELNLHEITEDPDHLDVLPQLQNQEWNWSNQQYQCTDFKGKLVEASPDGLLKTPLQIFKLIQFQIYLNKQPLRNAEKYRPLSSFVAYLRQYVQVEGWFLLVSGVMHRFGLIVSKHICWMTDRETKIKKYFLPISFKQ